MDSYYLVPQDEVKSESLKNVNQFGFLKILCIFKLGLMPEIAEEFLEKFPEFRKAAEEMTRQYLRSYPFEIEYEI